MYSSIVIEPKVLLFALFISVNLIASTLNHIDDTDETFGYWEVLHYVLNGKGMQTWEYAPIYAIRTYAFIIPIYVWCFLMKSILRISSPVLLFQSVRVLLGLLTAYCETRFVLAINAKGKRKSIATFTAIFLLSSAGVFLSSTAFLPSAVAMSLVMITCASWLHGRFVLTIFWACVAVLWTGWPFVGVMFLPLGLHMLASRLFFSSTAASESTPAAALAGFSSSALGLIVTGALVLLLVGSSATAIDVFMYRRWYVFLD